MNRSDLLHVLGALEDAEAEFEELMKEKEWYVTSVTDRITSSKLIITEELKNATSHKNVPGATDHGVPE